MSTSTLSPIAGKTREQLENEVRDIRAGAKRDMELLEEFPLSTRRHATLTFRQFLALLFSRSRRK